MATKREAEDLFDEFESELKRVVYMTKQDRHWKDILKHFNKMDNENKLDFINTVISSVNKAFEKHNQHTTVEKSLSHHE